MAVDIIVDTVDEGLAPSFMRPRGYQEEILNIARKKNTIVFLPTGSGKTYISIMLLKEIGEKHFRRNMEGHKVAIFFANTIQLVDQHVKTIQENTPFRTIRVTGELNVDIWEQAEWNRIFQGNDVLVMTPEVLKAALYGGFVKLDQICLMVFDECHHASKNHPMKKILDEYNQMANECRPCVLGLTAVLLLTSKDFRANLPSKIEEMEKLFQGVVVTSSDSEVRQYSTNPTEREVKFLITSYPCEYATMVKDILDVPKYQSCKRNVSPINNMKVTKYEEIFQENVSNDVVDGIRRKEEQRKKTKEAYILINDADKAKFSRLDRIVNNILITHQNNGPFAGLIACDYAVLQIEIWSLYTYRKMDTSMLNCLATKLNTIRVYIMNDILRNATDRPVNILRLIEETAPEKLKKVLEILKECGENDQILMFVKQQITARVICKLLRILSKYQPYSHLKPNFITGVGDHNKDEYYSESRRCGKQNRQIIRGFNAGVFNVLVCTQVLEEGTDIQKCNVVIQFDEISNGRSYIQTKGRARDSNSRFILFVENDSTQSISHWQNAERSLTMLYDMVALKNNVPIGNIEEYKYDEEEYCAPLGKCTLGTAPIVLERYFTTFIRANGQLLSTPLWFRAYNDEKMYNYKLQLPPACPLNYMIIGPWDVNHTMAKRKTALAAVKFLYEHGELDDRLLPVKRYEIVLTKEERLFPCWNPNDTCAAGTKKQLQRVIKSDSKYLCSNVPSANRNAILYEINFEPVGLEPAFSINCNENIGFVTSREVNLICSFPIYTNFDSYNVKIKRIGKIMLTEENVENLRAFHVYLFADFLKLVRKFLIYNSEFDGVAFFVAPLKKELGNTVIDWDMTRKQYHFDSKQLTAVKYQDIVCPTYQNDSEVLYIVTNNCSDKNSFSPFPDNKYKDYVEFYKVNRGIELKSPHLPLIETNFFKFKSEFLKPSAKKRKNKKPNLRSIFPLEVLRGHMLSTNMFMKFYAIPVIMHRLSHLHLAFQLGDDIRTKLFLKKPVEKDLPNAFSSNQENDNLSETNLQLSLTDHDDDSSHRDTTFYDATTYGDIHIVDLYRMERPITRQDMIHYAMYINYGTVDFPTDESETQTFHLETSLVAPDLMFSTGSNDSGNITGPTTIGILEALTTLGSDDVYNSERLETMGDSFLKFAVSLSLFVSRPDYDEGQLTTVKGRLLGNQNLFYIGSHFNIGSVMKVQKFNYKTDWCPPCFQVPTLIKELIDNYNLSSDFLSECDIPNEEQKSGELSKNTICTIQEKALLYEKKFCEKDEYNSELGAYLKYHVVNHKSIADCVEALIGLYLTKCGVVTAYRLLQYFNILIPSEFSYEDILNVDVLKSPLPVHEEEIHSLLPAYKTIEKTLGYTFDDKGLLLQAFLHSSHPLVGSKQFESYQKLEFIGDAIIDFLITYYIYTYCGSQMSPGELSDLRSALVNNVTFGCLAVRYGFHKSLKYKSPELFDMITHFAAFQEENHHNVGHAVSYVGEQDSSLAASYFVPKPVGDVFESIAGAIYLDCGKDLNVVWKVYYNLMKKEIDEFSKNVPINPVRQLYEKCLNFKIRKLKTNQIERGIVYIVTVFNDDGVTKKEFYGYGRDPNSAKKAAAVATIDDKPFRTVKVVEGNITNIDELIAYTGDIFGDNFNNNSN